MNIFCPSCFCKNEYKFKKPSFCSSCGKAFAELKSLPRTEAQSSLESNRVLELEKEIEALKKSFGKSNARQNYENPMVKHEEELEEDELYFNPNAVKDFKIASSSAKLVTVDYDAKPNGVTFGSLMEAGEGNSYGKGSDFEGLSRFEKTDETKKSRTQILEEIKLESSSQPRVINID